MERSASASLSVTESIAACRLRFVKLRRVEPFRMSRLKLPHSIEPVDIAVHQENEWVAERGVRVQKVAAYIGMALAVQIYSCSLHFIVESDEVRGVQQSHFVGGVDEGGINADFAGGRFWWIGRCNPQRPQPDAAPPP